MTKQIRNPKPEIRKKSEARRPKPAAITGPGFAFGFRVSDFELLSDFGLRFSDFAMRISAFGFRMFAAVDWRAASALSARQCVGWPRWRRASWGPVTRLRCNTPARRATVCSARRIWPFENCPGLVPPGETR